jgi:Protein of unknown function (DUF2909)
LAQPTPLQQRRAMVLGQRLRLAARKLSGMQRGQAAPVLGRRFDSVLLRRTVELPPAQARGAGRRCHSRQQDHETLKIHARQALVGQCLSMKILMLLMLMAVLGALASAGFFMLRKRDESQGADQRMARALALRVALSVALFLFILLSWYMGWVRPSGIPTNI